MVGGVSNISSKVLAKNLVITFPVMESIHLLLVCVDRQTENFHGDMLLVTMMMIVPFLFVVLPV